MTLWLRRWLVLLALAATCVPAPTWGQTVLDVPVNNAESTLAADHTSGSGTLVLATGTGTLFGSPSPTAPVRVTVARRPTMVNGQIKPATILTIFRATARSGDTLSGLTAVENTSDRAYFKSDPVVATITAGMFADLQAVIAAVPSSATVVLKANNLSDLASTPAARTNLGLGGAATQGVPAGVLKGSAGNFATAVADTDYLSPTGSGAGLSGVVNTTGNQTVAGSKVFSDAATTLSSANAHLSFGPTTGNANASIYHDSSNGTLQNNVGSFTFLNTSASGALAFATNGAFRVYCTPGGPIGVGTTNPASTTALDVVGVARASGFATAYAVKTANFSFATTDGFLAIDATAGAVTGTLPAASSVVAGRRFTAKKIDATANLVTIAAAGADTIDGVATAAIGVQYVSASVISDGVSKWWRD
jgi:hypothetical protein